MKKTLRSLIPLLCIAGFTIHVSGQVAVPIAGFPSVVGEYSLSYVRTNLNLSPLIGSAGSNHWDFSQAQLLSESVQRTDIVPVSDGGNGASFPNATYAERFTGGIHASPSWEYYQTSNGVGRSYYGYYDGLSPDIDPLIVFPQATIDFPDPVQYGHGWTRSLNYQINTTFNIPENIAFSETATVAAYGTLSLPGFGPLQALRVTQIDSYDISVEGTDFGTEVDTNYVWLVPGIGFAAEAIIYGPDPLGETQPFTNYFQRAFLAQPLSPAPAVSISVQAGAANLNWSSTANASGYVVMGSTNLAVTNWTPVAQLTNNSLLIQLPPGVPRQFYQVTAQP